MSNLKRIMVCILIIFTFILLHNPIMISFSNIFTLFRKDNRVELIEESYKEEIENLQKTISDYELSLNNLKIYDFNSNILSKIAIRNIYDFYNYVYITTNYKVKEGSAVINENGLVGIVSSSNDKTAKVDLLTGNIKLSVKVGDAYGIINEYIEKDNLLVVHNINNLANIEEGMDVYTSGLQKIDPDIFVGKVYSIEKNKIEKIVYVKSNVDFNNLNYLMVKSK